MNVNSKGMKCAEFVEKLKEKGFRYDGKVAGILRPNEKRAGRATRNGYRTISMQIDNVQHTFCEHRCVWVWFNGNIPDDMVINHKDFDRQNNRIENLELVTPSENIQYTIDAGRNNPPRGEKSGRALFTNKEVQAIRKLKEEGWSIAQLKELFPCKGHETIKRILEYARYGNVVDASTVISVYPAIVQHTSNQSLTVWQQLCNAIAGMCGELGEVVDILKKHLFQGHALDIDHLQEELGDLLYYITLTMLLLDIDMADAMYNNIDKLLTRYPEGFSEENSVNREK